MPRIKHPQTRNRILVAARNLFSQNGYHQTQVSDIIKKVGMAHGSFYTYFNNKHDLFIEILTEFKQHLIEATQSVPLNDIQDRYGYVNEVHILSKKLMGIFLEHPKLTIIFIKEAVGLDETVEELLTQTHQIAIDACKSYIVKGIEVGLIREDLNPEYVATATIGMILFTYQKYFENNLEINPEDIPNQLLNFQLFGIMKKEYHF